MFVFELIVRSKEKHLKWKDDIEDEDGNLENNVHLLLVNFHLRFVIIFLFVVKSHLFRVFDNFYESVFLKMHHLIVSKRINDQNGPE